jgi:RNA polymerase sigma-54 factor
MALIQKQGQGLNQDNYLYLATVNSLTQKTNQEAAQVLEQYISSGVIENYADEREFERNERAEEFEESLQEEYSGHKMAGDGYGVENKVIPIADHRTAHEQVLDQLLTLDATNAEKRLLSFLIQDLNDNGYLIDSVQGRALTNQELADRYKNDLPGLTAQQVQRGIALLQTLEPAGIGATSERECLLLQFDRIKGEFKQKELPMVKMIESILKFHFEDFQKKHFRHLAHTLKVNTQEQISFFTAAVKWLETANRFPMNQEQEYFKHNLHQATAPDIIVTRNGVDDLDIQINLPENVKNLKLSPSYISIEEKYRGVQLNSLKPALADQVSWIRKQLKGWRPEVDKQNELTQAHKQEHIGARDLLQAFKERNNMIIRFVHAMVDHHKEFFLGNDPEIKPLQQGELAIKSGLSASQVSSLVKSKTILTEQGQFNISEFFSQDMSRNKDTGISRKERDSVFLGIINGEDKSAPLSDTDIVKKLREELGEVIPLRMVRSLKKNFNVGGQYDRLDLSVVVQNQSEKRLEKMGVIEKAGIFQNKIIEGINDDIPKSYIQKSREVENKNDLL